MSGAPVHEIAQPEAEPPRGARGPTAARKRPRRTVRLVVAALVLLALAAGVFSWRTAARRPKLQLDSVSADRGRIVAKVTATGTLSAIVTVQVGSQVSGSVAALHADYNSRVRKGQLIAKIDPALFEATVEQARANLVAGQGNLAKAKAQAVDARRQAKRNEELAREKLVAQADYDTSQANADAADAAVLAAQGSLAQAAAALHQAQVNLAYTNIVSPTDGVVISRNVDVGQTVAASLQAPTLFVIAEDLSKMQVDTSVAEADVGRLRDGMQVTFTVDAYPAETFRGIVRQIRNAAQTVQNVVTYDAVIDVSNPELKLRPGMTANVTFVYAEKDDVLRVPNAALRFRPPPELMARLGQGDAKGNHAAARGPDAAGTRGAAATPAGRTGASRSEAPDRRTVWVLRGERPGPVRIRTGISDGSVTEVVEGALEPGDAVVTDASGGAPGTPGGGSAGMRPRLF
ncbi:MAG TPA: efflux RND transporter periplasmic adaptor subunit [Anaeromyxobacter sp.]|nr:efflux RND transporter periplasmic adaptor subunit [Anaeromyxobacter sp.]